ncbi:hypothetical protein PoB_006880500 [Plakobranchus ocellatus]|uniref:Uncharacterized protein n=1 Tax=Plakobranchus ocellatus TaxID=259542 RepID=A0AAV4DEA0_9GAST|nr:hypothetical protein PoB_006880500 [Plakobranchus ocellatus]
MWEPVLHWDGHLIHLPSIQVEANLPLGWAPHSLTLNSGGSQSSTRMGTSFTYPQLMWEPVLHWNGHLILLLSTQVEANLPLGWAPHSLTLNSGENQSSTGMGTSFTYPHFRWKPVLHWNGHIIHLPLTQVGASPPLEWAHHSLTLN